MPPGAFSRLDELVPFTGVFCCLDNGLAGQPDSTSTGRRAGLLLSLSYSSSLSSTFTPGRGLAAESVSDVMKS